MWTDLASNEGGTIVVEALLSEVLPTLVLTAEGESLELRPARGEAERDGCHG